MKVAVAVLDACVLYPPALRDLFMWLAVDMVYQPRWTDQIHDEWIRNVKANRPEIPLVQLQRTRQLMDRINDEALVHGYEDRIPHLTLPDPDDRHVLAAAIEAKASFIVTFNLSDFPKAVLIAYGIRAIHPDAFLCNLYDDEPDLLSHSVRTHRASLKKPSKAPAEYVDTLKINGLKALALRIESHIESI
ncbi:MAG: PIN domain-containing protein [Capsulimonadaceae bacterium]